MTLIFKTANQAICMTIWSMIIYNYNTKSEYKRLSNSKDKIWTQGHMDTMIPIHSPLNFITLFIGDTSNQCSHL